MGTAMFSKIYRIVTKWYGGPRPEAFEDAMLSYTSGYFEGQSVFYANDPGDVAVWKPVSAEQLAAAQERMGVSEAAPVAPTDPDAGVLATGPEEGTPAPSEPPFSDQDPNRASMRINLNGIKTHNVEPRSMSQ